MTPASGDVDEGFAEQLSLDDRSSPPAMAEEL
jgi:hypothetical protein